MKSPLYALTAIALAVTLAGCSSNADAAAEKPAGTTVSAEPSAEVTADPAKDPLNNLPDKPFGIDPDALVADPAAFGIQWQLTSDQDGVPVAEALRAFLQAQWLANERQVVTGGANKEKILGSLRDAERFVVPDWLGQERERAEKGLAFAELVEAEGDDADYPTDEAMDYPLHLGTVAVPNTLSGEELKAMSEKRAAQWPDVDEHEAVWVTVDGETEQVPFLVANRAELTPRIFHVYDSSQDFSGNVVLLAHLDYELPLEDGRTALLRYTAQYEMADVDGEWRINFWDYSYEDTKPTVTIKK